MKFYKKLLLILVVGLIFLFRVNSKIYSIDNPFCYKMYTDPIEYIDSNTQINGSDNSEIYAYAEIEYYEDFNINNYRFAVNEWGTLTWFEITNLTSTRGVNENGEQIRIIRGAIPKSQLKYVEGTQYGIYIETTDNVNLTNESGECFTSISIQLDPNALIRIGNCEQLNLLVDHYDCFWNGESWQVRSNSCTGNKVPDRYCYNSDRDINSHPESYRTNFCGTCTSPNILIPQGNHGDICITDNDSQDCVPPLHCRISYNGTPRCLYPVNNRQLAESCIIGEAECKTNSGLGNLNCKGENSQNLGEFGRCSTIEVINEDNTCSIEFSDSCNDWEVCIDNLCVQPTGIPPTPKGDMLTPTPWEQGATFTLNTCWVNRFWSNTPGMNIEKGIQTAIGCLPSSPQGLLAVLFRIATGIGGGIAFLLILYGGLRIMIARGDPKAMEEGKEIITAAIVGLILILLSVYILRILGVDILGIPGFS